MKEMRDATEIRNRREYRLPAMFIEEVLATVGQKVGGTTQRQTLKSPGNEAIGFAFFQGLPEGHSAAFKMDSASLLF